MAMNHPAVAALPANGGANHALMRSAWVARTAYVLADEDDSRDLICLDPADASKILTLIFKGNIFDLDPLDSTTEHDGVSCLESFEGYRYKVNEIKYPDSVLDKDLTSPPADPAFGDAYILLNAGEDDWGNPDFIGKILVWTARGWEALSPRIGRKFYVEDEDSYYYLNANGDWTSGVGAVALQDNSASIAKLIGGGANVHWQIINQTTNDPPGAPTKGDAYIAGPAPTGAWAGGALKIWVWEGSNWRSFTPANGWRAYDIAKAVDIKYSGGAWLTASGFAVSAVFSVTGFGANIAGANTSVDQAANTIKWNAAHGFVTGDIIALNTVSSLPAPLLKGVPYYVRVVSPTDFALYQFADQPTPDISRIDLTNAGTGTWTIKKMVGVTIDDIFGVSAIEIVGVFTSRIIIRFSSAFADLKYRALPIGITYSAGTSKNVTSPQPVLKRVSDVSYDLGMDVAALLPANWIDLDSATTIQFQLLIAR